MRGAVSVALVYHFFDFTDQSEHVASIIGMTIIVVVFSTMVFGAATKPLLDVMLGKQGKHLEPLYMQSNSHMACMILHRCHLFMKSGYIHRCRSISFSAQESQFSRAC